MIKSLPWLVALNWQQQVKKDLKKYFTHSFVVVCLSSESEVPTVLKQRLP